MRVWEMRMDNGSSSMPQLSQSIRHLPGIALSLLVTLAAVMLEKLEFSVFGHSWLESLVLAIVVGTLVRSTFSLHRRFDPGIDFSARILLECAVVLLGASISLEALGRAGAWLVAGIALTVVVSILLSYWVGRAVGLPPKLATLIACGNSICGNSAIAATAPVIDAKPDDVAASIAFTAVLGVAVVLGMPVLNTVAGLSDIQYGTFAGLTVYAVPQVLAATAPIGIASIQTGTLVKLIRVLMLGPVIFALGLIHGGRHQRPSLRHMVPWFIVGFALLMAMRSLDLIPPMALAPLAEASGMLTIVAMAALGLSVDIRHTARAGGRVMLAAVISLLVLGGLSLILIAVLGIP
ncbi:YeiH family putative sulfate export transporter [Ciceribacter sp. L1K23]|nr:YeiH family putative sulfate export transporter [Ciceribacter sp. L1K23]